MTFRRVCFICRFIATFHSVARCDYHEVSLCYALQSAASPEIAMLLTGALQRRSSDLSAHLSSAPKPGSSSRHRVAPAVACRLTYKPRSQHMN